MTTVYPEQDRSRWIVSQRPPRDALDPFRPHGFFLEEEPDSSGRIASSAVVLLTNKECPWRCLMCDLWKNTLSYTVPSGAIPAQIDYALAHLGGRPQQIKLYNSGSFFDPAAIPPADYAAIARGTGCAEHVVVECHPRLINKTVLSFRDLLNGALEVAMGLETAHPESLKSLNKKFTLRQFAAAADFLQANAIALRVFLLVNPPFIDTAFALEWTLKSAQFAFDCGASVVSLIPTRGGNGAMDRLTQAGEFTPPFLIELERSLEACLSLGRGRVFADTWNLAEFSRCPDCLPARSRRLAVMNLTQRILPQIRCQSCAVM